MLRTLLAMSLLGLLATSVGCAMCCAPYDDAYPAYGGRWQRDDMNHGRVGSAFTSVGSKVTVATETAEGESIMQVSDSQPLQQPDLLPTP